MRDSVSLRGIRTGTPVPRQDREQVTKPSLYIEQWGPDRVAQYLAGKYPPTRREKKIERKAEEEMTAITMTKEEYLLQRLTGKKRSAINKELGVNPNVFYKKLGEWGIKQFDAEERAIELFASERAKAEQHAPTSSDTPSTVAETASASGNIAEASAEDTDATTEPAPSLAEIQHFVSVNLPIGLELLQRCFDILADDAYKTACDKGWHIGESHLPTELALIHSEVSEALEADRKDQGGHRVAEELADIVIRVMDTARSHKLDVAGALIAKMEKNKSREFRDGNLPY